MFLTTKFSIFWKLTFFQKIIFLLLYSIIYYIDLPLIGLYPLRVFSKNFKLIVCMALNYNNPQKFIDMALDASEIYYFEKNNAIELEYYTKIILLTPKNYRFLIIFICLYKSLLIWLINFVFWIYSISLPFFFLCIFLLIDYLDGYFD